MLRRALRMQPLQAETHVPSYGPGRVYLGPREGMGLIVVDHELSEQAVMAFDWNECQRPDTLLQYRALKIVGQT